MNALTDERIAALIQYHRYMIRLTRGDGTDNPNAKPSQYEQTHMDSIAALAELLEARKDRRHVSDGRCPVCDFEVTVLLPSQAAAEPAGEAIERDPGECRHYNQAVRQDGVIECLDCEVELGEVER